MATGAKMTTMEEPADRALGARLGSSVAVTELWDASPARFRLEFTNDARSKEMRWVLFTGKCETMHGRYLPPLTAAPLT